MALLTVSTESALTEAANSMLTASVFHGLAANFGLCACVLHVTNTYHRNSALACQAGNRDRKRIIRRLADP